ncbi:MAG: DUF177 domain-containing protein [Clostridia bacterium]|nr:DUF177 domain-containing protein [Clostridia bacterium]
MQINLTKVLNEPDSSMTVSGVADVGALETQSDMTFPSGARFEMVFKNLMDCVTLSLKCECEYLSECARCLKEVKGLVSFEFESIVKVDDESGFMLDSDAVLISSSNRLDTDELVAGLLVGYIPMKVLCREDCRGLCPTCGHDLNEGDCGCSKKEVDPRLLKLKALLDNDK